MRKGLSSSAAVCVLVVKCFNETYGLGMTQAGDIPDPYTLSTHLIVDISEECILLTPYRTTYLHKHTVTH